MLLLASSDAKTWTLHKSTINVDTLLITLYETYEPVCMKQNLELKLHLSEESYPAMLTDKDRLFQILCAFMDNAIQHSPYEQIKFWTGTKYRQRINSNAERNNNYQ